MVNSVLYYSFSFHSQNCYISKSTSKASLCYVIKLASLTCYSSKSEKYWKMFKKCQLYVFHKSVLLCKKVAQDSFFSICKKKMPTLMQFFSNLLNKIIHKKKCTKMKISFLQSAKNYFYAIFLHKNTFLPKSTKPYNKRNSWI